MGKSERQEAARAHRARCKGRYHAVDDGAWRAYVCSACGHVSGCECAGEATDCVGADGMPLRATELRVVHVEKAEVAHVDGDEPRFAVVESVLDAGTCGPCSEAHGTTTMAMCEHKGLDGPLNADGTTPGGCRCVWVAQRMAMTSDTRRVMGEDRR